MLSQLSVASYLTNRMNERFFLFVSLAKTEKQLVEAKAYFKPTSLILQNKTKEKRKLVSTFHQTSLLSLNNIPLKSQTIVDTTSFLYEAAPETHWTTLKLRSVCACVCVFCDKTQMNTNYIIYTASLLYDVVYYIYFSYRNHVGSRWMLPLKRQIISVKDDSLSMSALIFLMN